MALTVAGIPDPERTALSGLVVPVAASRAPEALAEFAQPRPAPPVFPHGPAVVCVPSPKQNGVPRSHTVVKPNAYEAVQLHSQFSVGLKAPRYCTGEKKPSIAAVPTLVSAALAGRGSSPITGTMVRPPRMTAGPRVSDL